MEPVVKLTKIKVYKCNTCTESFISEEILEKHSKLHVSKFSDQHDSKEFICLDHSWSPISIGKGKVLRSSNIVTRQNNDPKTNTERRENLKDLQIRIKHAHSILKEEPAKENAEFTIEVPDDKKSDLEEVLSVSENTPKIKTKRVTKKRKYSILKEEPEKENAECTTEVKDSKKSDLEEVLKVSENPPKNKTKRVTKKRRNYGECEPISNDDGTFKCAKCCNFFLQKVHAVEHYKRAHFVFTCEHCNVSFTGKYAYTSHINKEHTKKFACPHCQKVFGCNGFLKTHINSHLEKNERPFVCSLCDKRFTQISSLNVHYKGMHVRLKDHICSYCKKAYSERGALERHERIHTGKKPYECKYCKKSFSDPSAFQRHIRTHTKDLRYACPECPKRFTDASGLIAHKRRHFGIKDYFCNICSKKFYDLAAMRLHENAVHLGFKNYECHHCAKRFSDRCKIQTHIYTSHQTLYSRGRYFECHYCGKKAVAKTYLKLHIYAIHGEEFGKPPKRVQCRICGVKYRDIKRHTLEVHEQTKRFECHFCETPYQYKSLLAQHIYNRHRVEAGLRSIVFKCRQCKKECKSRNSLNYHKKSAHGVVLYCNLCNNRFFTAEGLETHKKSLCKKRENLKDTPKTEKAGNLTRQASNTRKRKDLYKANLKIESLEANKEQSYKKRINLKDSIKTKKSDDLACHTNTNMRRSKHLSASMLKIKDAHEKQPYKKRENLEDSIKTEKLDSLVRHTDETRKSRKLSIKILKVEGSEANKNQSNKKTEKLGKTSKTDNQEQHTINESKIKDLAGSILNPPSPNIILHCNVCLAQFAATQLLIDEHKKLCQGILITKEEPMDSKLNA